MDEEIHTRLKRPMAPYFAIPSLLGMESAMDQIQQELEDQICRRVTIDVVLWMQLFSLESLHWIAFSNKLGYLSEGKDTDGILSILQSKFMFACYISTTPIVGWLVNFVAGFIGPRLDSIFPKAAQELQSRRHNEKPHTGISLLTLWMPLKRTRRLSRREEFWEQPYQLSSLALTRLVQA